jgi:hypothetical protein
MPGSWDPVGFPDLSVIDYCETSPSTDRYNCIAWAAGVVTQWWWPDPIAVSRKLAFWPRNVPIECTLDAFVLAYGTLGYMQCGSDGTFEEGFDKIALFAKRVPGIGWEPTHAAIQTDDGCWSSKLGECEDIEHFGVECLRGPGYGEVVLYLKRPDPPPPENSILTPLDLTIIGVGSMSEIPALSHAFWLFYLWILKQRKV